MSVINTVLSHSVCSYSGANWKFFKSDIQGLIEAGVHLDALALRILVNRGFTNPKEIGTLLNASFRTTVPDPSLILDMDKAVARIYKAIANKEKVSIFGDYDVDGVTSTYLLVDALRRSELNPSFYLPNRLADGYGLNKAFIDRSKDDGVSLIITTDCGIGSIDEVRYANEKQIDVVIFDHHAQLMDSIPPAVAVVNANRQDQVEIPTAGLKNLCAAGVVFMFLVALRRYMRAKEQLVLFNPTHYVDSVALGTISDLVPLLGINRALVIHLIQGKTKSLGLKALMAILEINEITVVEDISYRISPLINAAGRLGQANKALSLLLTEDKQEAVTLAYELLSLNDKRREVETNILAQALQFIEQTQKSRPFVCAYGDGWHEGVLGIISGKLRERFNKPSFVISFTNNGEGHGSVRSVPGLHIGEVINSAVDAGILIKGGGHEMAGGLTLAKENIGKFIDFLEQTIPHNISAPIEIDACLSPISNLEDIIRRLQIMEPFGQGFGRPVFAMLRVRVKSIRYTAGGQHVRIVFKTEFGQGNVRCSLFNACLNKPFIEKLFIDNRQLYDIVGIISYNKTFGASMVLKDIRLSQ